MPFFMPPLGFKQRLWHYICGLWLCFPAGLPQLSCRIRLAFLVQFKALTGVLALLYCLFLVALLRVSCGFPAVFLCFGPALSLLLLCLCADSVVIARPLSLLVVGLLYFLSWVCWYVQPFSLSRDDASSRLAGYKTDTVCRFGLALVLPNVIIRLDILAFVQT